MIHSHKVPGPGGSDVCADVSMCSCDCMCVCRVSACCGLVFTWRYTYGQALALGEHRGCLWKKEKPLSATGVTGLVSLFSAKGNLVPGGLGKVCSGTL